MSRRNFKELKQAHPNSDFWIIAGGASLNYVDPSFFEGKLTMGLNESFIKYQKCTYYAKKDGSGWQGRDVLDHIRNKGSVSKLIVSDYRGCAKEWGHNEFNVDFDYWFFEHPCGHGELDESVLPKSLAEGVFPNGIGMTGIAISLAAYLGARNIICCGNDAVLLDGKDYFDGYADSYQCPMSHRDTLNWGNGQNVTIANYYRKIGINVHALNPFINLRLEGHTYAV
jgi:hypothetical protein